MLITHEVIRRVRRISGLEMVCGRDALAGMHAHNVEDLMNRVPGGDIAPMEALVSANSFAAEAIKMADQIGLLAPELEADIIGLDDDRVTDIAAVCRVVFVVQGGVVYKNEIGPRVHISEPSDEYRSNYLHVIGNTAYRPQVFKLFK